MPWPSQRKGPKRMEEDANGETPVKPMNAALLKTILSCDRWAHAALSADARPRMVPRLHEPNDRPSSPTPANHPDLLSRNKRHHQM